MKLSLSAALVIIVLGLSALSSVDAHSWLVEPVSRETGPRTTDGTVGCPDSTPKDPTAFAPGDTIDVRYWRNNHLGGFIRWAISPVGQESAEDFDSNVFYYTCRESGPECVPNNGGDNIYAGDNSGDNTISCGDTITLPDWLDEGDYVLQWTWFGVGSSYGNIGWAEPQFVSCADITLTSAGSGAEPSCPTFVGGDRVTDMESKGDDVCWYYYTNDIVAEQYKGSNDESAYVPLYMFGKPADVESCGGGSSQPTNSTEAPATTEAPETDSPEAETESPEAETESPEAETETPEATESPTTDAPTPTENDNPETEEPASTPAPSSTPRRHWWDWTRKPAATEPSETGDGDDSDYSEESSVDGEADAPTTAPSAGCNVRRARK